MRHTSICGRRDQNQCTRKNDAINFVFVDSLSPLSSLFALRKCAAVTQSLSTFLCIDVVVVKYQGGKKFVHQLRQDVFVRNITASTTTYVLQNVDYILAICCCCCHVVVWN